MNVVEVHTVYKSALHFLALGQLKNSFDQSQIFVDELQMGEYSDRLNDLQQNYRYLLHYYTSGVNDPERKLVYNKLIAKIYVLVSELREELMIRNSTNFEYAQKRYFPHTKRFATTGDLLDALNYYYNQSKLLNETDEPHEIELKRLRANYESALPELFRIFWLNTLYRTDEKNIFAGIFHPDFSGWIEKSLVVSAITLNLWRMFDEQKLMMLLDCCQHEHQHVKQRAMVGLSFILAKYNRFIPFFPIIRNRLVLLADDNRNIESFRNIFTIIISTSETDKISKKMQEEILPEMMKISPMLRNKMDEDSSMNSDEWMEENPEWQDFLEQSGVADKLQELNDLQMEGADVYMSTFSMLKNFSFFSEFANWFLPFDSNFSSVNELFKSDEKIFVSAFANNNIMCNSDKYSFCLSILQMPESQRGMLKQSFRMEAEQLNEMSKDEAMLNPDVVAKNIAKQYIQDLFRFFKLHPQHADFSDMFTFSLTMHRSYLFDILSSDAKLKTSIAEYYFAKNHYREALELYAEISQEAIPTSAIYQKIGYSHQQLSELDKALEAYKKADIIQPDDSWTIRKIALCYRLSGNFEKALEYYQHADFLQPDQPNVIIQWVIVTYN
jgi:tetratricopeptide (TPR) repeat protein